MKTKSWTQISIRISLGLTTLCLLLNSQSYVVSDLRMGHGQNTQSASAATVAQLKSTDAYVVINKYAIHENAKERLGRTLNGYVQQALANENNIMAEVFQEEQHPSVLWVLERWNNKEKFEDFSQSPRVKELISLTKTESVQDVTTYHLKDLAPLSKSEWRKTPSEDDNPIVIMLFVDSKKGTEENFKKLYETAMPEFRSEPGVITYGLSQFENDRTQFVTYEKFRNEDAFQYHLNFPPIKPVLDYLNTSIKRQPFQTGLHRLVPLTLPN